MIPAAYPWFGAKSAVAHVVWEAFGDVPNYVEPFGGTAAVLLARPAPGKVETVNEINPFIVNFLRAVARAPEDVAAWASWPVSEVDMHARHAYLVECAESLRDWLQDPDGFDAKLAGWWVWGQCIWIGSGWCSPGERSRKIPELHDHGKRGIHRARLPHLVDPHNGRKLGPLPSLSGSDGSGVGYGRGINATGRREDLGGYFRLLAERLSRVRFTCGDWSRVCTEAVTISHGLTGVFLDPNYGEAAKRTKKLYADDDLGVAAAVRAWALEHGDGDDPRYRIALCGYEGEHEMPASWRVYAWKAKGGYGNQGDGENVNAGRERIWFSPHCLGGERVAGPLFERAMGVVHV